MRQPIERLTERQKDCLRLVGRGFTSKQIGRQLGISPATVDNHVRDALATLRVESRAEAARLLLDSRTDQPLTSQTITLAEGDMMITEPSATDGIRHRWRDLLAPPLGGKRNSLEHEARIFAIVQVAVLSFAILIVLTLGVAAMMWLLR